MWWGSEPDPGSSGGEGSKEPPQNQSLVDLQEQFEQQQTFIAQLKEMLRKTEQSSSVSREKVEEYASTLSEINARAKLSKIKRSEGRKSDTEASSSRASSSKKSTVVTPAKEKINLLRQQLEENRIKLAERDKSQKDVEVMVNQLRAQLDESQATINDPVINIPKQEIEIVSSYSSDSSKDDLLFAIKSKDESIIELTAKVQQLQANVLDLQENIKEKDSVIDARTKAITLLSENLSKKGKDTLDMLEDTKVQMRNMQQNFVTMESKMKEENVKLQSELVIKERKIQELTEINNNLESSNKLNEELQNKIHELEDSLRSIQENVEEKETLPQKTKRKGSKKSKPKDASESAAQTESDLSRISDLEKLVDELNAKLEEANSEEIAKLNKQLEEMNKNMIKMKAQHKAKLKELQKKSASGELNDKVTNLESENVKLGQRLAELEEEKGNLQLKLVDYESNKEKEYIADLENKIEEQKMEIENHIRTITSLESQITVSSNELSTLRSELANMMHIENAQVCSEITSVQLEEQLDKEVSQKKEIQDKYNEIIKENEHLADKIQVLNKEKQDLGAKLDQYMQENIDLIDRLEKLSAEKVSSAESIEIVDALTQQEKLEIEAYQKLDFTDSDKPDLEQNQDISESVSKLNEETSELMEKIKLFTDERREVMEKMDSLAAENHELKSKLETLEENKFSQNKMQEELIEYRAIIENQKLQIASLQEDLWNKSDNETNDKLKELNDSLNSQLRTLQAECESLYKENETFREDKNKIKELRDENKRLEADNEKLNILESELSQTIEHLNIELDRKEKSNNESVCNLSTQLSELKAIIAENFEQLQQYEEEMNKNSQNTAELQDKLEELNFKIVETEHIIEMKNLEIEQQRTAYETKIKHLEDNFNEICRQLKEKCKLLENQIQANSGSIEDIKGPFEAKIADLEHKNKEQVEKMKKIAANLKKKSNMCQELEIKLAEFKEKWENEAKEKDDKQKIINKQQSQLEEKQNKIVSLVNQLQEVENELSIKNADIEVQMQVILELKNKFENKLHVLKSVIAERTELQNELEQLNESEKSNKKMIRNLTEQLELLKTNHETSQNAMEAKLQEKDLFIENLEAENTKYKDRINRLEEGLSNIEERRQQLEKKAFDLKVQLDEKSFVCEEVTQSEDLLERRLSALLAHDEIIEQKLEQTTVENQTLTDKIKTVSEENYALQLKLTEINSKLQESAQDSAKVEVLENEISRLSTIISTLENEVKKRQMEHEKVLTEIENMETEFNQQLQELHTERKNLLNKCEVLEDNYQMLTDELDELKNTYCKTKKQLDEVILENQQLVQNNEINLSKILDLENNSGSITDEVINNEIGRLQNIITQKDTEINNYQKQNMQLQMSSFAPPSTASFFTEPENKTQQEIVELNKQISSYCEDLSGAQNKIKELEDKLQQNIIQINYLQQKLTNYQLSQNELQELLVRKTAEQGVAEIIATAEQRISTDEVQKEIGEITKEELLRKIKALEFMLFNIEKEKDDTLVQCHEFTNELAHLIYEREQKTDSQIISATEANNKIVGGFPPLEVQINKELREDIATPVVEDVIQSHKAYLCYAEDPIQEALSDWGAEDSKIQESIESQIVQLDETKITPEDKKQFELMQFVTLENAQIHEIPEPKHAYVCYPETKVIEDTFASEEDGWGWNAEEAKLEAEHRMSLGDKKVEQLEERIHDLEVERSRLLEEIKASQVRSGKLIKKLKLMKEKTDNLEAEVKKKSSGDFCDLELTIQDELNAQVQNLEKKIKELNEDNSKDKAERENLLKKLEVITNANERMIEMKEKQDNEIQFLLFKNKELSSKLEQLEWGDDSPGKPKTPIPSDLNTEAKKVAELNSIINDLTLDNEEMQCMLEEQRNMRLEAEKALSNRPIPENMKSEQEFLRIESELIKLNDVQQVLEDKYLRTENENKNLNEIKLILEDKISQYIKNEVELREKSENYQLNIENLVQENQLMNNQYLLKIEQLQNENLELQNQITQLQNENLQQLTNLTEKETLSENLMCEISRLENLLVEKEQQLSQIELQETLNIQNVEHDEKVQQINEQLMTALANLDNKNKEISELNIILNNERVEFEQKINTTVEKLAQQWTERVDERGNEVAESWKLHLESIQNEFTQKEENLRTELNNIFKQNEELLEQNNALQKLVSDNNTTVETLQQEINELLGNVRDKESEILKLSKKIKKKESEILDFALKLQESSAELLLKNNEIKDLQLTFDQIHSKELEYQNYIQQYALQLQEKSTECNNLQEKLQEITDLKQMIENQVLKIEDLKKEIEQKDADYNSLIVEVEKFEASFLRPPEEKLETEQEPSAARAELDIALYMLHQRDVRCEELTVELMQLLEERDTLQLKLSNAIRVNEELKFKHLPEAEIEKQESDELVKSTGAIPKTKSKAILLGASGTELATEATENISTPQDFDELTNKLSQLHTIGYNRDKTLKDDQETRHIQQMTVMQQHRDLASRLPAEAAARLVDASYTVSRDVQSPSKVLLNWLWGRSTPKVNDV